LSFPVYFLDVQDIFISQSIHHCANSDTFMACWYPEIDRIIDACLLHNYLLRNCLNRYHATTIKTWKHAQHTKMSTIATKTFVKLEKFSAPHCIEFTRTKTVESAIRDKDTF